MKKIIFGIAGLVLGVLMVWLLFRSTNWAEVGHALSGANYFILALALALFFIAHPARVVRWGYIVRAVHPATFRQMFSATQIGFLANFVLPGRAGEAVRALVLTRLTRVPFSKSFAFVAVDRLTDLFGLIAVMLVSIFAFRPAADVSIPPETFGTADPITFTARAYNLGAVGAGGFLAVLIAGFAGLYTNRGIVLKTSSAILGVFSKKLAEFVNGMINHFADGLSVFRSPADMAKSIGWSLITWALNLIGLGLAVAAFHVDFPWYTPVVMQAILAVFIAAPNTPGFVGQFHIPIVLALVMTVPGVDINTAKACAIAAHLLQIPPVFALGIWSLMRDNLNLFQLQREGEEKAKEEKGEEK